MTTGIGPYVLPDATDSDDSGPGSPEIEATLTATQSTVNVGGITAHAEVFNGTIPGPTFRLTVGDRVAVRLINDLPFPLGIHWHGIELENSSDGTEITQDPVPGAPLQILGNGVPAGGTFLYKFKVTRAGLFWYHSHHGMSINRVFRGLYGLIVVTDPMEANIVAPAGAVLPSAADTLQLVLSDITVCKGIGSTDPTYLATYVDPTTIPTLANRPEWLSGLTAQVGPDNTPKALCELAPTDDMGNSLLPAAYAAGDIPSLAMLVPGRMTEGQTVLTNGFNAGGRLGTPSAPGALVPGGPAPRDVLSGQGLRLQIANCGHLRYFRLRLTTDAGAKVNLLRIGGEGGLLDSAILEGGLMGTLDSRFESGEIVLGPGMRADVVAAIPAGLPVGSVLTLWTRDYQRAGNSNQGNPNTVANGNWAQLPSVPVMHLKVTGAAATAFTISAGTALRTPAGMPAVETLGPATAPVLINPTTFGKVGTPSTDIQLQTSGHPSMDGVVLPPGFMNSVPYTSSPHIPLSSRWALSGKLLELTVTNASSGQAHHPYHLHGFSFQPVTFEQAGAIVFTFPHEFRDTIDVPPGTTLRFRVRLDDRNLADDLTTGGALGRWLMHCHIFFHHMAGMISELVVSGPSTQEKPNVNVGGSWAYAPVGGTAKRDGTFFSRDGLNMTLSASKGSVVPNVPGPGGAWNWSFNSAPGDPDSTEYVYITAEDTDGRKDQAVFRLQIGGADTGSDVGDPHILTVDGTPYDFQAAGEFTLLRDREGMEIQVRQTPVETPPPVKDDHTGLTVCVSLNTAVAVRLGSHRISYQPFRELKQLQFLLDGEPVVLQKDGIDVDGHRVTTFDAGGETALRVDYAHGPVVMVTPHFWASYGLFYMDVSVSHTNADEGLMGTIQQGTWLPRLPSGATVGQRPASLDERFKVLYGTFADAWRVTKQTSMFTYTPSTTTETFTDRDWPRQKPPCTVPPAFKQPLTPILENIDLAKAEQICGEVTIKDLHANCVFDVATTGDETFARGYLVAQELRRSLSAVQIFRDKPRTRPAEAVTVTAIVLPLSNAGARPAGSVTFLVDDAPAGSPVRLDREGRASLTTNLLERGDHRIRAVYSGDRKAKLRSSSSPHLLHTVGAKTDGILVKQPPRATPPQGMPGMAAEPGAVG